MIFLTLAIFMFIGYCLSKRETTTSEQYRVGIPVTFVLDGMPVWRRGIRVIAHTLMVLKSQLYEYTLYTCLDTEKVSFLGT